MILVVANTREAIRAAGVIVADQIGTGAAPCKLYGTGGSPTCLVYGYGGGGNYLGTMEIQCQHAVPNQPWKYGEPHFELRSPVDDSLVAKDIPCGGIVWDLDLTVHYRVLGYEGDVLWYSGGCNARLPGDHSDAVTGA